MLKNIITLFEEQVEKKPNAIAVYLENESINYREFNNKINQYARILRKKGVKPNTIVGIELNRSYELLIAIFSVIKAGGCYLPIDPESPSLRKENIINNSGLKFLISSKFSCKLINYECINFSDINIETEMKGNLNQINRPNDLAYIIHTSGSTGEPKGVMIQHKALLNRIKWMNNTYSIGEKDILFHKTHQCFDVSIWEVFWWSISGSGLVILPKNREHDICFITKMIFKYKVSVVHFVPSVFNIFLDYIDNDFDLSKINSLRFIFSSGEALDSSRVKHFFDIFNEEKNTPRLINLYGPTEATIDVTFFECKKNQSYSSIPIGKPIDNTSLFVLDNNLNRVGIEESGELFISGKGLSAGYLNNSELTSKFFIKNPYLENQKMYKTGDQVKLNHSGDLVFLGRLDDQIKLNGQRIELKEIEQIIKKINYIKDAHITYIENEFGKNIIAFIIIKKDFNTIDSSELKLQLSKYLPKYMIPNNIKIVDAFPIKSNGKIDSVRLIESKILQSKTIISDFEEKVKFNPNAICVMYENTSLTYDQVNKKSNQIGRLISKECSGRGECILVYCDKCIDILIFILAILKAGATYVPIDVAFSEDRIKYIQKDTSSKILITNKYLKKTISRILPDSLIINCNDEKILSEKNNNLDSYLLPSDSAYVIYTSGTTGYPKGVMVEHGSVKNMIDNQLSKVIPLLKTPINCLQYSSIAFDAHISEVFFCICSGQTLVIANEDQRKDTFLLKKLVKEKSIDFATIPPVLLRTDIECALSLKVMIVAGEATEEKILDYYSSRGVIVLNAYGPTEASVCTSMKIYNKNNNPNNVGRPIDGARYYILDEDMKEVSIGEVGELFISGKCLARGYLNNKENNVFFYDLPIGKKHSNSNRYYKTGDRGFLNEKGEFIFIGRIDNQIKINGIRIELLEIENTILNNTSCEQCVAVPGKNKKSIVIFYVCNDKSSKNILKNHLIKELSNYMFPIVLKKLESLPTNFSGKIDRSILFKIADDEKKYVAYNRHSLNSKIKKIIEEFVDIYDINESDNFFDLGINSIDIPIICRKISKTVGKNINSLLLYHNPCLSMLINVIEKNELEI
ncbi:non-ribosomal peptide synthetase [Marinomonas sp. TI.3.20]|uniref:non-ribosomal peptide synthetase n=1 Tax=Marinomonas sp. TI.3.20 TaxID=3121296 RepID=UPI00311F04ED